MANSEEIELQEELRMCSMCAPDTYCYVYRFLDNNQKWLLNCKFGIITE